jgi:hypothetical protein
MSISRRGTEVAPVPGAGSCAALPRSGKHAPHVHPPSHIPPSPTLHHRQGRHASNLGTPWPAKISAASHCPTKQTPATPSSLYPPFAPLLVVHAPRQKGEEKPNMSTASPLLTAPAAATDVALPTAAAVAAASPTTGMYVAFEGSNCLPPPHYPSLSFTQHTLPPNCVRTSSFPPDS